ncbi:MAG: hypothetical protein LBV79_08945, partial [Candidatus Adiutrix sp.]|nr:hypothetical protein [Candidatus Adiutrix sp.]
EAAEKYTQAASEAFAVSADVYANDIWPGVRKKEKLVEFALLAGAGLLVALCGLLTSAVWTVIQSRQRVGQRVSSFFRFVFPQADFNQILLFSAKNYKELLWWTAAWLAAPLAIVLSMAYLRGGYMAAMPMLGGLYPLAVIISSFYIFSFWLTLAIYARRGKLADPGEKAVKFQNPVLLLCFFFTYAPLLERPLDFIFGLCILLDLWRHWKYYWTPPYWKHPSV